MNRRGRIIAAIGAAILALTTMFTGIGSALAETQNPAPAPALTDSQKQSLQAEVNKHLKDYGGGRQIAINEIAYQNDRLILTLPLPGEKKARSLSEPVTTLGTANCSFEYACLWTNTNFEGTRLSRYACETVTLAAPFTSSVGSIHNNQTTGTQTMLLNASRQILNATLAPSRVNDTGVGTRYASRFWVVC
ncbi:hypothetical protein [Herbidospora sp. RD11066]